MTVQRSVLSVVVAVTAVVVLLLGVLLVGPTRLRPRGAPATSSVLQAATVNPDVISRLPEFVAANREIQSHIDKSKAALGRVHDQSVKQYVQARLKMQQDLDALRFRLLRPLNNRVAHAIAAVAAQHHLKAVVDSRIVLTGLPDITAEVAGRFPHEADTSDPQPANQSDSPVALVDQSSLRQLPEFQDLEVKLRQEDLALIKQHLGPDALASRVTSAQDRLYGPLEQRLQTAIHNEVAQHGASIVLDRGQVLWGGDDLTSAVVSQLQGHPVASPVAQSRSVPAVGMVNLARVAPEVPEYSQVKVQFEQQQKTLLQEAKHHPAQARAATQRWEQTRQKLITDVETQARQAASQVARDKHLAAVIADAPWSPFTPLAQYGATDITTDVLFAMHGK
ncbi:MAG: OmpH family outer membrane protein [Candidatus Xenobia bacterium]